MTASKIRLTKTEKAVAEDVIELQEDDNEIMEDDGQEIACDPASLKGLVLTIPDDDCRQNFLERLDLELDVAESEADEDREVAADALAAKVGS